jgi:tRNA(His) 5'-end guanylyltransferase
MTVKFLNRKRSAEIKFGINQGVTTVKKATNIQIQSKQSSFKTSLFCLIAPKITENLPLVSFDVKRLNLPNNIKIPDPQFHVSRPIDLLIGNEQFWNLICIGQIRSHKRQILWVRTANLPSYLKPMIFKPR